MTRPIGQPPEGVAPFVSGLYLPSNATERATRVLFVAVEQDEERVSRLLSEVAAQQLHSPTFKPVFLLRTAPVDHLRHYRFVYETVVTRAAWEAVEGTSDYQAYLRRRVEEMRAVYRPHEVVSIGPDALWPWAP